LQVAIILLGFATYTQSFSIFCKGLSPSEDCRTPIGSFRSEVDRILSAVYQHLGLNSLLTKIFSELSLALYTKAFDTHNVLGDIYLNMSINQRTSAKTAAIQD